MIDNLPITLGDMIKLTLFGVTVVGTMLGIMAKVLCAFKKYTDAIETKIAHYHDETESKRRRIYERLDEVKRQSEDKYVTKDIFSIMNETYMRSIAEFKKELDEVKHDVKILLTRNGGNQS